MVVRMGVPITPQGTGHTEVYLSPVNGYRLFLLRPTKSQNGTSDWATPPAFVTWRNIPDPIS
eukprot:4642476-Pyramimonas_sp.AAC.1